MEMAMDAGKISKYGRSFLGLVKVGNGVRLDSGRGKRGPIAYIAEHLRRWKGYQTRWN